jgi:hypothetical protein
LPTGPRRPSRRRRLRGYRSILAIAAILLTPAPAFADCESGIAVLVPKLAGVSNVHTRELLIADLKRAQFELWEFDEVECAMALDHAARLLRLPQ